LAGVGLGNTNAVRLGLRREEAGTVSDEICLEIPAQPEFVFLARVTAAKLAARQGFLLDQIEDLRLAVAEVLAAVMSSARPDGKVRIEIAEEASSLRITASTDEGSGPPAVNEMSKLILDELVDEHRVFESEGRPAIELRLRNGGS
jgi:serine/threonine-protein kinase RsbW